ncbi:hypothetical protein [Microtetraspora fusca]|uniref:hypothetical protein n=1 Tax=Microtetraspora fusca TaxID=1997 RepID=UPI000B2955A5|nr:hypothetical protein [Microtetraspora fusca]
MTRGRSGCLPAHEPPDIPDDAVPRGGADRDTGTAGPGRRRCTDAAVVRGSVAGRPG